MPKFIEFQKNNAKYWEIKGSVMLDTSKIDFYARRHKTLYVQIGKYSYYKDFQCKNDVNKFIKEYFQTSDSKPLEELKEEMKKINENIEEIRDMIKYHVGGQIYMESKEDFDTKK